MKNDSTMDNLLDLHGSILDRGGGYRITLKAWQFADVDRVLLEVKKK